METITTNFREVSFRAEKSGKCITCGKRKKRTKRFWQTLNPFNKRDGVPKSRQDIMEENIAKAHIWREEPIDCCKE